MFCPKCGSQNPDGAVFCMKCGASLSGQPQSPQSQSAPKAPVLAPMDATSLKCPNCGAPISPKFGEMVITCEYCGSGVTLGNTGWTSIQKSSMLPIKFGDKDPMMAKIHELMDNGFLHRHVQEQSTLQEMTLSMVPYWIVPVSARTSIVAANMLQQTAQTATTAALFGVVLGGFGGGFGGGGGGFRPRRMWSPTLPPIRLSLGTGRLGMFMGGGMMGGGGGARKAEEMDNNYNFPVVALKALTEYQPKEYVFNLTDRTIFDVSKIPKGIPVLNGDVGEDDAKNQAKTYVDQVQSQKAHDKYHMIQQLHTDMDVGDAELLHAPIWFARYDHKGERIALAFDANSGMLITSIGLK
ncbi:MAG: zinc ribbon domain-containing protein [Thaumarchaeota archaeon]|nr:zinc ribbon domain-containing protein [Nitrososphaerota archaeon]